MKRLKEVLPERQVVNVRVGDGIKDTSKVDLTLRDHKEVQRFIKRLENKLCA